jgi:hypothetical protein
MSFDPRKETRKFSLSPDVVVTVVDAGTVADVRPGVGIREGVDTINIVPAGTTGSSMMLAKNGDKINIGIKSFTQASTYVSQRSR